jgi:hypothetical protein
MMHLNPCTHIQGPKESRAIHVSSYFFFSQVREEWKKLKSDMVKQKKTDKGSFVLFQS